MALLVLNYAVGAASKFMFHLCISDRPSNPPCMCINTDGDV